MMGKGNGNNFIKRKMLSVSPPSTGEKKHLTNGEKRPGINYEDKIR